MAFTIRWTGLVLLLLTLRGCSGDPAAAAKAARQRQQFASHLLSAAKSGDVSNLQRILEPLDSRAVNLKLQGDVTALQVAVATKCAPCVKYLLEKGADIEMTQPSGFRALHFASTVQDEGDTVLKMLIKAGADVNAVAEKSGHTPLLLAAGQGLSERAKFLVKHGANVTASNKEGVTALHYAAARGDLDFAQYLLGMGANISAEAKPGETALFAAVQGNKTDMVEWLLSKASLAELKAEAALYTSVASNNTYMVNYLLAKGVNVSLARGWANGESLLHLCARKNLVHMAKYLMEEVEETQRIPVDDRDRNRVTPLQAAAQAEPATESEDVSDIQSEESVPASLFDVGKTPLDTFKLLLAAGADANALDDNNITVLHVAARQGHLKMAQMLIDHGASIHALDMNNASILFFACAANRPEMVKFLLDKGVSPMQSVLNGMTPLIANLLREGGSVPVVKMLLEAGADPMQADQRGGTPLHYSASKDNRKVSQLLLDYGANLEVMDNRGFTVLFAAANDGSFKTAGWLLRKGADPLATNFDNKTASKMINTKSHKADKFRTTYQLLSLAEWLARNGLSVPEYLPVLSGLKIKTMHNLADMSLHASVDDLFAAFKPSKAVEVSEEKRKRLFEALKADSNVLIENVDKDALEDPPIDPSQYMEAEASELAPFLGGRSVAEVLRSGELPIRKDEL
mmetsp:Transcript_1175/g.2525  ORF Transcript_1175/g.2525 Transcript_1175/m.2525 type:complete len:688 (+) Transcript_1175:106-2169(+)